MSLESKGEAYVKPGITFANKRQNGQVDVSRYCGGPDLMPLSQPDAHTGSRTSCHGRGTIFIRQMT